MNLLVRFPNIKRQKYTIARVIACGALILPSCRIPELRQADPGPVLPASFTGAINEAPSGTVSGTISEAASGTVSGLVGPSISPDSSGQLGVEEFYKDRVLTQLIDQALVNNRELKVLNEEVQVARSEVLARQGAYLPFVTAGGGTGLDLSSRFTRDGAVDSQLDIRPNQPIHNPLPDFRMGLNLFWRLDIWRALRNARDAAAQRYIAASEKRNDFVTRLVAEIAENYYGLVALDKRLETLNKTIELQQQSLEIAIAKKDAGRGTELAVQRFQAEVRKNQSEKLITLQDIIETENRINFRLNRVPMSVERTSADFYDLNINTLSLGVPSQLLQNRPDIRQAERELQAAGLDVKVARAHFFPDLTISAGVGYQAFNPKYLFNTPEALAANVAGDLVTPLINKKAIRAEYLSANAKQLESVYNYQRVVLNAFTEVINRVSMVENYRKSIEIKKQQLAALEASVDSASKLFQNARAEYVEVLLAQRDFMDARMVLIDTKRQQLGAVVNAYQALGGGNSLSVPPGPALPPHRWRKQPQP
ncbi:membrane protein : Outer membrane protein OS=Singulisphaera acidiphila (strain ATCC BAA-1392 / DSM 18658 / VKM B-2454 / MOB10) GN=Sinac_6898 PE=4 SV=1: OEP: OEP [Gemmata massiliana]|uniref:Uncharacterized protein n=1 Tax=Gemmata massiliana TaxID=1210884 RepID=A0A6P2DLT3_9BACT|nr:membrane protein : Outer membrane protein OS=Singulisphaera acidiphila (strain ATCC BAA-1392 / DSM 18658 / VKM B-2454 / MOB10) GN=Sinac_6898 PE=4 SV=1: OEP: OEP [Gemmata massiliana]